MTKTSAERRLKVLLWIWIISFTGASALFLFYGTHMLDAMNQVSARLLPSLAPIALVQEKFWLTLVMSLMITLIFICYQVQRDIRKNLVLLTPLLLSKFTSAFFFFVFFVVHQRSAAHLIGTVVDGGIFLITYYFYQAVKKEISRATSD